MAYEDIVERLRQPIGSPGGFATTEEWRKAREQVISGVMSGNPQAVSAVGAALVTNPSTGAREVITASNGTVRRQTFPEARAEQERIAASQPSQTTAAAVPAQQPQPLAFSVDLPPEVKQLLQALVAAAQQPLTIDPRLLQLFEEFRAAARQPFRFDPESSPSVQALRQLAERQFQQGSLGVLNELARRGIMLGTPSADRLALLRGQLEQGVLSQIPELERQAFAQHQAELGNALQALGALSGLVEQAAGLRSRQVQDIAVPFNALMGALGFREGQRQFNIAQTLAALLAGFQDIEPKMGGAEFFAQFRDQMPTATRQAVASILGFDPLTGQPTLSRELGFAQMALQRELEGVQAARERLRMLGSLLGNLPEILAVAGAGGPGTSSALLHLLPQLVTEDDLLRRHLQEAVQAAALAGSERQRVRQEVFNVFQRTDLTPDQKEAVARKMLFDVGIMGQEAEAILAAAREYGRATRPTGGGLFRRQPEEQRLFPEGYVGF